MDCFDDGEPSHNGGINVCGRSPTRRLIGLKVGFAVGAVMVTVGSVASVPVPVTIREMVSKSAVKLTFAVAVEGAVGLKRTVTVWVAATPTRVNGLPETMLKGAGLDAVPETVPLRVLCTVKVRSTKLPRFTLHGAGRAHGKSNLRHGTRLVRNRRSHCRSCPPRCHSN